MNFNPARGSEQAGLRPAVVIQNDVGNRYGLVIRKNLNLEKKKRLVKKLAGIECKPSIKNYRIL